MYNYHDADTVRSDNLHSSHLFMAFCNAAKSHGLLQGVNAVAYKNRRGSSYMTTIALLAGRRVGLVKAAKVGPHSYRIYVPKRDCALLFFPVYSDMTKLKEGGEFVFMPKPAGGPRFFTLNLFDDPEISRYINSFDAVLESLQETGVSVSSLRA